MMAPDAKRRTKKSHHLLMSEWVMIICFVVLVITTFLQVIFRYVVNLSLSWADELARYVFVWLVFSGFVVSFARGEHAIMNFVVDLYRGKFRTLMLALIDALIIGLFVVLAVSGVMLMQVSIGQSTAGLGIPKLVVYAALPFGSVMMLIELVRAWRKRRIDTHEV
jgi:TRAP-type transport system small permease protein